MVVASWGPLGKGLGALLGRRGALLGGLEAVLGVLGRSFGESRVLGPSWGPLGALLARLGALLAPKKSCDKMPRIPGEQRQAPGDFAIWGPVPIKDSSAVRTVA